MTRRCLVQSVQLPHIAQVAIDPALLERRFAAGCAVRNCQGACCGRGVEVDIAERDRILEQAPVVRRRMDPGQERDSARWFEGLFADSDFPSGEAASTVVREGACVFLNSERLCVLQMAEADLPLSGTTLKPFFCRAYPLTLMDGVLVLDDEQCAGQEACCTPVADGPLDLLDTCAEELEFTLGPDGVSKLRDFLFSESTRADSDQSAS